MVGAAMNIENKLLVRRIKRQLPQIIAAALIIAIGAAFFVTLKTVLLQYEKVTEEYFTEYSLADYTIYGTGFDKEDISKISHLKGVKSVQGRFTGDYRVGNAVMRVLSTPIGGNQVNRPYIYEGRYIESDDECMLLKKHADAYRLKVGDTIELKVQNQKYNLRISALITTPEYVYLAQSESVPMADPYDFGVMLVSEGIFNSRLDSIYNEINILFDSETDATNTADNIKNILKPKGIMNDVLKDNLISYKMYQDDLTQIDTFAYIFPVIFFIIGAMIIYVMQKRNIAKERKQIGIIKALGFSDTQVLLLYTKNALIIALIGSISGCLMSIAFGDYVLNAFRYMFDVPGLAFAYHLDLWLIVLLASVLVCILSNFVGIKLILKINPAEAMHAEKPKSGKRIFIENIKPLWHNLSFNTRYALKTSLRNKGRFFAVIFGMTAAVSLTVFALGFSDSFDHLINKHYNNFTRYDLAVNTHATPFDKDLDILTLPGVVKTAKTVILPVNIESESKKSSYPLLVVENDFDMLDLKNHRGETITIGEGVVLPAYVAGKLGVTKGDTVRISSPGNIFDAIEATITDLSAQASGFHIYSSFDFIKRELSLDEVVYNNVLLKTEGSVKELSQLLDKNKNVLGTTSIEQDKNTLLKLLDTIGFLINTLIIFAIVLGVAVLYAVGIINLSARSYEFIVLKVMGYSTRDIVLACLKETLLQITIAIPLGFGLGNLIIFGIKDEFSNDFLAVTPHIYRESYLYAILLLITISILLMLFSVRFIRRLNMIEGLKLREE